MCCIFHIRSLIDVLAIPTSIKKRCLQWSGQYKLPREQYRWSKFNFYSDVFSTLYHKFHLLLFGLFHVAPSPQNHCATLYILMRTLNGLFSSAYPKTLQDLRDPLEILRLGEQKI